MSLKRIENENKIVEERKDRNKKEAKTNTDCVEFFSVLINNWKKRQHDIDSFSKVYSHIQVHIYIGTNLNMIYTVIQVQINTIGICFVF